MDFKSTEFKNIQVGMMDIDNQTECTYYGINENFRTRTTDKTL